MHYLPRRILTTFKRRQSREPAIVLLVLGILVLSQAVRLVWVSYLERGWESIQEEKAQADIAVAVQEFGDLQQSARSVAVDVGQQADVLDYLCGRRNDRRALFAAVARATDAHECGVEVYDTDGELAAWGGSSGPSIRREVHIALDGQMTSVVVRTPVASQLLVASPVRSDGKIVGVVVVRQTVELDYPLSNRFISFVGLNDRLGNQLGTTVEFNFSGDTTGRRDGRWLTAPLHGIDKSRVGIVSIQRPARSAVIEHLQSRFAALDTTLLVLLCLAGLVPLVRWLLQRRTAPAGAIGLIAALWSVRYLLVWVGFPGRVISLSIFDPSLFASAFGGGLARSAGDLFVSVLTLSLSLWCLVPVTRVRQRDEQRSSGVVRFLWRTVVAVVMTFFLFWLLRGLGAVVRSALYDSTLGYGDPGIIVPSFAMSMMILSLGMLCAGMLSVAVRTTEYLLALLGSGLPGGASGHHSLRYCRCALWAPAKRTPDVDTVQAVVCIVVHCCCTLCSRPGARGSTAAHRIHRCPLRCVFTVHPASAASEKHRRTCTKPR